MPQIGILAGQDRAFTDALIARLNTREPDSATYVTVGGVRMAEDPGYRVILDRISHVVPFYQSYLKHAAVMGCHVINDPLWQLAEDKFLDTALALELGLRVPRTVLLPNREHVEGVVAESLRNRAEPLDWEAAMAWVGFPMILRPHWGAGSRKAFLIHTPEELAARWDRTGRGQMILQEWLSGAKYVHCLVVGGKALPITRPMRATPPDAPGEAEDGLLAARVAEAATAISRALGYHMNAVEFAVRDGEPYATDWLNYCPPVDPAGLTPAEMDWVLTRTAELALDLAATPKGRTYRWDALLQPAG